MRADIKRNSLPTRKEVIPDPALIMEETFIGKEFMSCGM